MKNAVEAAQFNPVAKQASIGIDEIQHVFSVDVEEWFQVGAFENSLSRSDWSDLESRVVIQTEKILSLLERTNVKATFFCLGWVAEREPELIKKISDHGHEVACHGMDHRRLYQMDADTFYQDILHSKALLEKASGQTVYGYRAPSFSMSENTWDYYPRMIEAGFKYSSSVFPGKTDHYGMPSAPRLPFYPLSDESIIEVPMTVSRFGSLSLPASGGGYFRLLPSFLSKALMTRAFTQTNGSTIFYMHPWEVDPEQPRVTDAPFLSKFRHYSRQNVMEEKLEVILKSQPFTRMDHMLNAQYRIEMGN
ncbi:XrtA system polysaccharide deacetylase [Kordiimonas aquimaris]|uniref:XrtA system polysaccharide deacetylase n=1 Tax=Kordiimonas aquimaris TaxID=707591 RepID=UPI0021D2DFAE|nr:XrtA system polysaccharide deacetylase [Kordiimonas aquimaris]